jgi:hypothetical protein
MNLYLDQYYKNDCENKVNHSKLLYNQESVLPADYAFTAVSNPVIFYENDTVIVAISDSIDDLHLIKASGKEYCQEFKISDTVKKFIV